MAREHRQNAIQCLSKGMASAAITLLFLSYTEITYFLYTTSNIQVLEVMMPNKSQILNIMVVISSKIMAHDLASQKWSATNMESSNLSIRPVKWILGNRKDRQICSTSWLDEYKGKRI